jgi:hypothetical protein
VALPSVVKLRLDWRVTPADPDAGPQPEPESGAPQPAEQPVHTHRRWPWIVLLVLVLVAALGVVVGGQIILRGRSFGTPLPADTIARPTFVIATPPSPTPRPAAVPSATAGEEYTVETGDTLRSIAERVYGDAAQWPRVYDANRETVGPDPDTLKAGTRLRIPRP